MKERIKMILPKEYPDKLRIINRCPEKMYAIGNVDLLYEDSFAIVGTRRPTMYGKEICKRFTKEFALRDIPIVSGLAEGIDQISHNTVLEYGNKTIGVLGCGIEYYLKTVENHKVFLEIIEKGGLILSEYAPNTQVEKENFPQRNRIIAALSEGALVVEAAFRSGSSITARWAKEYKKEVFAIPGRIGDKMFVGTNCLLKKGAILSTRPEEIIESYPQFANKKRKNISQNHKIKQKEIYKNEWKEIINILRLDTQSFEELQIKTGKDIRILFKVLSEMELEGIIEQDIGIGYKLTRKGEV